MDTMCKHHEEMVASDDEQDGNMWNDALSLITDYYIRPWIQDFPGDEELARIAMS